MRSSLVVVVARRARRRAASLPLAACARDAPRSARDAHDATTSATRSSLARAAAPHRLAQSRRPPSCSSPSARAPRSSAARRTISGPTPRVACPTSAPACARTSRRCSPRVPTSSLLYASDDNRDAARRLRAAGVATAAYRVDRIADFRARHARARRAHRRSGRRARHRRLGRRDARRACAPRPRRCRARPCSGRCDDQPLLAIGGGSFLNELIDIAGGTQRLRLPAGAVAARSPSRICCSAIPTSSSPRPSRARAIVADPRWRALRAVRDGRVLVVDTMLVGRPGPRLGEAARSLARLLHPGAVQ